MSLVNESDMTSILTKVSESEKIKYEHSALKLISDASDGSVRKALVMLSQVMNIGVNEENVRTLLKRAPRQMSIDLLNAISCQDRGKVFQLIETASIEGRDLSALLIEAARALKTVIGYKVLKIPQDQQEKSLNFIANGGINDKGEKVPAFSPVQIIDAINNLLEISSKLRQNVPADILVQANMLKIIDRFAKLREATK
jgi:DNA polymerase III gamma/tau subunit